MLGKDEMKLLPFLPTATTTDSPIFCTQHKIYVSISLPNASAAAQLTFSSLVSLTHISLYLLHLNNK